ncbi:hypothetical protein HUE87_06475 [Candidatus Sulfurimonas marisnigri]|uniref:Uncharacterized protein n=1 Tax=Candidatus Sulfurimonas marisnigri TaxID=2740405 RepID=A0A7S7LZS6_9BACT|nr:hypothetical protein [Candidatus Sulfurimonas marisnigri]QOY53569.1 hypothetical protein HUE87_06475 [Candidatus Sulfurimonas marisnigri]
MAIDNSLYDSLENTYFQIKDYLDNNQLGREHSAMIIKHEELADLLERFDIEALEEQSKDINTLHEQFNDIKEVSNKIVEDLKDVGDSVAIAAKVVSGLDKVFLKIANIIV